MPVLFFRPTSVYREYRCRTTLIPRSQRERIVFLNKVIEKKLSTLIYTDLTDFLAKPIMIFVLSTHIENYSFITVISLAKIFESLLCSDSIKVYSIIV